MYKIIICIFNIYTYRNNNQTIINSKMKKRLLNVYLNDKMWYITTVKNIQLILEWNRNTTNHLKRQIFVFVLECLESECQMIEINRNDNTTKNYAHHLTRGLDCWVRVLFGYLVVHWGVIKRLLLYNPRCGWSEALGQILGIFSRIYTIHMFWIWFR